MTTACERKREGGRAQLGSPLSAGARGKIAHTIYRIVCGGLKLGPAYVQE